MSSAFVNAGLAFGKAFNAFVDQMISAIAALPGQVAGAISAAFGNIGAMIKGAIMGSINGIHGPSPNLGGQGQQLLNKLKPQPMNFSPPSGGDGSRPIVIHATLDGEVVHRSVVSRMASRAEHPTQAAYFDGMSNFASPDSQFSMA